jgi:hypothetical protein
MALRVPKAELPAGLREDMIRQLGAVPEPVEVMYNNPEVAISSQEFSARVATWDAAGASLKTFAHMAVAAQVGCSWCLDVNYFLAQHKNLESLRPPGLAYYVIVLAGLAASLGVIAATFPLLDRITGPEVARNE